MLSLFHGNTLGLEVNKAQLVHEFSHSIPHRIRFHHIVFRPIGLGRLTLLVAAGLINITQVDNELTHQLFHPSAVLSPKGMA